MVTVMYTSIMELQHNWKKAMIQVVNMNWYVWNVYYNF